VLPCITAEQLAIGPLTLPVQGVLAFAGAVVGHAVFVHRATAVPMARARAEVAGIVGLVAAVVGGHVLALLQAPLTDVSWLQRVVQMQASLGALGGGAIAVIVLALRWRLSPARLLDAGAVAFACGWPLVRLGCALVHDHIGRASTGPLAVAFPGGGRYDVGLLEWLASVPLMIGLLWLSRRSPPAGVTAAALGLAFVVIRLPIEWLRVDDLAGLAGRASVLNLAALGIIVGVSLWLLRGHRTADR